MGRKKNKDRELYDHGFPTDSKEYRRMYYYCRSYNITFEEYCTKDKKSYEKPYKRWKHLEYKTNTPEYLKTVWLNKKYGISLTDFNNILKDQNFVCAICQQPEKAIDKKSKKVRDLAVDHCHITGKMRALLCTNCNMGLGAFKDNLELLQKAVNYISFHINLNNN